MLFPLDFNHIQCQEHIRGYWLFFVACGPKLHDMWHTLISHIPSVCFVRGAYVSDNHFFFVDNNGGGTTAIKGAIHVYCDKSASWAQLQNIGVFLAQALKYTSVFGKLCFESNDIPSQHLIVLPVPLCERTDFQKDTPTRNMFFDITHAQGFAHFLGARWSSRNKCWFAPDRSVWNKLIVYFAQREEEQKQQTHSCVARPKCMYSVYSLNVCFSASNVTERMLAIFVDIQSRLPDLLCLQEVTLEAKQILDPLLASINYVTPSHLYEKAFGELLYIRTRTFYVRSFEQFPLTASQQFGGIGHEVHKIDLQSIHEPHTILTCVTAHLATGRKFQVPRRKQLEFLCRLLNTSKNPAIFAGDTNLSPHDNYVGKLLDQEDIGDAWQACGAIPVDKSTWNSRCNTRIQQQSAFSAAPARRFDRVLFTKKTICSLEFALVCTEPVSIIDNQHASDHFGIFCRFQVL